MARFRAPERPEARHEGTRANQAGLFKMSLAMSSDPTDVQVVDVFADGPGGGNPAPIAIDARRMSDTEMQDLARHYGHESGFVIAAPEGSGCDLGLRFWVPNHEMSMCGHATVGAVWLLDRLGRLPADHLTIWTASGIVEAIVTGPAHERKVAISQPRGKVEALPGKAGGWEGEILSVLGIGAGDLAPFPIRNAATSRIKTMIPLRSVAVLDALRPDFDRIESLCAAIDSTGLYPFAVSDSAEQRFDARQFPRSSGYPEDAATGIAAAALAFQLLRDDLVGADRPVIIRQGRAMGHPSRIEVRFRHEGARISGCWLGGAGRLA
jgi:PhzF family phenazine biosynthesis protein